jgi:predicted nucleic acid-binding protein
LRDYLDSSAVVKLIVDEPGSDALWVAVGAVTVSTCRITFAEVRAAIARRERETPAAASLWQAARDQLPLLWQSMQVLDVTQALVERAGELADVFGLRGYDAVQLAAAEGMFRTVGAPMAFHSFDRRLNRAARVLGLMLPAEAPQ